MSARSYLSIGDVLTLLRQEFPDVTISKIRFLESQGLVNPERTPSGYRKFYEHDVERLRWVLRQQREHFLPLKVIKDRLGDGQEASPEQEGRSHRPAPSEPRPSLVAVGARGGTEGEPGHQEGTGASGPEGDDALGAGTVRNGLGATPARASSQRPDDEPDARRQAATPPPPTHAHPQPHPHPHPQPQPQSSPAAPPQPVQAAPVQAAPVQAAPVQATPVQAAPHSPPQAPRVLQAAIPEVPPAAPSPRAQAAPPQPPAQPPASQSQPPQPPAPQEFPAHAAPAPAPPAAVPPHPPAHAFDVTGASLTPEELAGASGLPPEVLTELRSYGLLAPTVVGGAEYYDEDALAVANLAAAFARFGVEPRHLRMYRNAAEREAGFIEQVVVPLVRQRNPEARARASQTADELSALGQSLRSVMLRASLRQLLRP